ncbi:DUF2264 domain-containing protein [Mucilaginibacter sp.]|uniref:DUF2264 domain-containing protein n=1 Tax=Mucilaginibacter sp. TaxID=1882438 RepID=UPI0025F7C24B|nr:DUF2264 domain-containing protein [Mucilaginibacter sp.]
MKRRSFLQNTGVLGIVPLISAPFTTKSLEAASSPTNTRNFWLNYLQKLAEPVLTALAVDQLKQKMPVEAKEPSLINDRAKYTHLEAFGRLLCGITPWLQAEHINEAEKHLQTRYFKLVIKGIENATNPAAKDYMNWGDEGGQPLVDASFFAYGLIRCPKLWEALDAGTRKNVIAALLKTRKIKPPENNWLLFAAMIEAFFITINQPFEMARIDYAIKQHQLWYKGDGLYGDGAEFHWDYYNSFVIHPYLYDVLKIVATKDEAFEPIRKQVLTRNLRYSQIQERLIGFDGTYPIIGRSITYRTGAFHHLANMAYRQQLPKELNPAQVRCALTTVIKKVTDSKEMFDENGWLRIGVYGHQPSLAETYISTGSLYLCSAILLPLGLSESDLFWSSSNEDWSAKKAWKGGDLHADHAL